MRIHDDKHQHDSLNDRLDALAEAPPASSRANDLDAEMRDSLDQFFDLAEQAGATSTSTFHRRSSSMNATLPVSSTGSTSQLTRQGKRRLHRWTDQLHLLSTGLLIVAVVALSFAAFGSGRLGGGGTGSSGDGGDGLGLFGAVPVATAPMTPSPHRSRTRALRSARSNR